MSLTAAALAAGTLLLAPVAPPGAPNAAQVEPALTSSGSALVAAFQVGRFRRRASSRLGWASSRDGGRSWRSGLLPLAARGTDPSVAFDAAHGEWIVAAETIRPGAASIVVVRSRDGRAWGSAARVATAPYRRRIPFDKPWLACGGGACYVAYTDLVHRRLSVRRSSDGGTTWARAVGVPETRPGVGAQPAVLPGGPVVIVYLEGRRLVAARSADGGASFGKPIELATVRFRPLPGLRIVPLPSLALGARGELLVAWPDCRFRARCAADDLVVARSRDGRSWSAPARVPTGAAAGDRVLPALAADGSGAVAIAYDRISTRGVDVAVVVSASGGATWQPPRRLNARTMPTRWFVESDGGRMLGDYLGAALADGAAVAAYAAAAPRAPRVRQAIYAARTPLPPSRRRRSP